MALCAAWGTDFSSLEEVDDLPVFANKRELESVVQACEHRPKLVKNKPLEQQVYVAHNF